MSKPDDQNTIDEDAYIIEDSGESLETFDLEREEAAARDDTDEAEFAETGGGIAVSPAELARLQHENVELKDRLLRARADFDNFRKRVEREKSEHYRFALIDFVRELLPVIDNFERALSVQTDSAPDLLMGVEMIYKQLGDVLARVGLKVVEDAPAPFDPTFHEAVTREDNTDVPNHTVTQVMQKGYVLNDRLIRPAMVKVAVGGEDDEAARTQPMESIEDAVEFDVDEGPES